MFLSRNLLLTLVFMTIIVVGSVKGKRQLPIGNTSVQCHSERWGELCPNGCLLCNIKFMVTGGARKDIRELGNYVSTSMQEYDRVVERIEVSDVSIRHQTARVNQKLANLSNATSFSQRLTDELLNSLMQSQSALETLRVQYRRANQKLRRMERNLMENITPCSPATDESEQCTLPTLSGRDCAEIYRAGARQSGVYVINPTAVSRPFRVYCDMDDSGGGWTVVQRRSNGSLGFDRSWREYKEGFNQGSCNKMGETWIGNENLYRLTQQANQQLKVTMTSWQNETRHAKYRHFQIDGESTGYRLMAIDGYRPDPRGDVGDAFREFPVRFNNRRRTVDHLGARFTTSDVDNDGYVTNCAADGNGGWWFRDCGAVNLNGIWRDPSQQTTHETRDLNGHPGIYWKTWNEQGEILKETIMKIRPLRF